MNPRWSYSLQKEKEMLVLRNYHVQRWRNIEDMRIRGFLQVRQAVFGYHEGTSCVDTVHQVISFQEIIKFWDFQDWLIRKKVLFHVGGICISETDCGGIVNENINSSEFLDGLLDGITNLVFESDVTDDWQCFSTSFSNFLSGSVNCT